MGSIMSAFFDDLISASRPSLRKHQLVVDILTSMEIVSLIAHMKHLFELRRQNPPPRYSELWYTAGSLMFQATAHIGVTILQCITRVPDPAPFAAAFMCSLLAMLWSAFFVLLCSVLRFQWQSMRAWRVQVRKGKQAMWVHLEWRARNGRWIEVVDKGEVVEGVQELSKRGITML
jgi:hypothetical protein